MVATVEPPPKRQLPSALRGTGNLSGAKPSPCLPPHEQLRASLPDCKPNPRESVRHCSRSGRETPSVFFAADSKCDLLTSRSITPARASRRLRRADPSDPGGIARVSSAVHCAIEKAVVFRAGDQTAASPGLGADWSAGSATQPPRPRSPRSDITTPPSWDDTLIVAACARVARSGSRLARTTTATPKTPAHRSAAKTGAGPFTPKRSSRTRCWCSPWRQSRTACSACCRRATRLAPRPCRWVQARFLRGVGFESARATRGLARARL